MAETSPATERRLGLGGIAALPSQQIGLALLHGGIHRGVERCRRRLRDYPCSGQTLGLPPAIEPVQIVGATRFEQERPCIDDSLYVPVGLTIFGGSFLIGSSPDLARCS